MKANQLRQENDELQTKISQQLTDIINLINDINNTLKKGQD